MNTAPRFLIAKYVENIQRMEPRNIGVILWSEGRATARFVGESDTGEVATKPQFIRQRNFPVYRDWVAYWKTQLAKKEIAGNGTPVPITAPEFLDALCKRRGENYILVDGGIIPATVPAERLGDAVRQLYSELVEDGPSEREDTPSALLDSGCRRLLQETGLKDVPDFHPDYSVRFNFRGVDRQMPFSFGIGPGGSVDLGIRPDALFQKVLLRNDKDVASTLFMMETVTHPAHKILPQERCASLVYASDEDESDPVVVNSLEILGTVSVVVNVAKLSGGIQAIRNMNLPINGNGHHSLRL